MPLFFFNIRDGKDVFDTAGTDLSGIKQIRKHMVMRAMEVFEESDMSDEHDWEMEALDSDGKIIATMTFSSTSKKEKSA